MVLLGYRVNNMLLKQKISLAAVTLSQLASLKQKFNTAMWAMPEIKINLPSPARLWEQARKLIPSRRTTKEQLLEPIEASPSPDMTSEISSIREVSSENSPVKILEGTIQGKKFRLRIFTEPTENPSSEVEPEAESKQQRMEILSEKLRDTLQKVPAEPFAGDHQSTRATFSED